MVDFLQAPSGEEFHFSLFTSLPQEFSAAKPRWKFLELGNPTVHRRTLRFSTKVKVDTGRKKTRREYTVGLYVFFGGSGWWSDVKEGGFFGLLVIYSFFGGELGEWFLEGGGEEACFLWMVYVLPVGGSEHCREWTTNHWCALETWFSTGNVFYSLPPPCPLKIDG